MNAPEKAFLVVLSLHLNKVTGKELMPNTAKYSTSLSHNKTCEATGHRGLTVGR